MVSKTCKKKVAVGLVLTMLSVLLVSNLTIASAPAASSTDLTTTSPMKVVTLNGQYHVFIRGADGAIYQRFYNPVGNTWSGWIGLGGWAISAPAVVATPSGEVHLFVQGGGYAIYQNFWNPAANQWSGWMSLGGVADSEPVVAYNAGRFDIFVRASNHAVYQKTYTPSGGWTDWSNLGGIVAAVPSVAALPNGEIRIFARGGDNGIYQNILSAATGTWAGWTSLGGISISTPAVAYNAGRIDLFVRAGDNSIYQKTYKSGSEWSEWEPLGGLTIATPAAFTSVTSEVQVYVIGGDGATYQNVLNPATNNWSGWMSLGGVSSSQPILTYEPGQVNVFIVGSDSATVFHNTYYGTSWTGWASLGAPPIVISATANIRTVKSLGRTYAINIPAGPRGTAINTALNQLGKSYTFGAEGPNTFDCSGLMRYSWQAAGVGLPRVTASQWRALPHISKGSLLPGDLVFYYGSPPSHVGMYLGNGLMINAPHRGTVVQINPVGNPITGGHINV